jgi:hypothetical protein
MLLIMKESDIMGIIDEPVAKKKPLTLVVLRGSRPSPLTPG